MVIIMLNSEQTLQAIQIMGDMYPTTGSSLVADTPFHFLLAVMLSAQTTDKAVNMLTPAFFKQYPTPKSLAAASELEIQQYIKTIGLYRNKAKYLHECAQSLVDRFAGEVPRTRNELMQLQGVGRKTANVVLAECFGIPALAVDTHVSRIARRLAIVPKSATVSQIEAVLMNKLPKEIWITAHHRMITWGREQCSARAPKCRNCPLLFMCNEGQKRQKIKN